MTIGHGVIVNHINGLFCTNNIVGGIIDSKGKSVSIIFRFGRMMLECLQMNVKLA